MGIKVNALEKDATLGMSFVTYAELLKGAARRTRKAEVLCQLGQLVRVVPVFFDTSQTLCHHYAVEANRLRTVGTPISGNDLWIACHALMLGAVLVTNNLREFARIERLRLENWVA